jgi:hypothetical protein
LDIGAMNDGVQQQAQRIYQNYVVLTAMVEKRTFPD